MPDTSTSDSDPDESRLHIEDRARVFACVYSRTPNRIGFAVFDRDSNAIAIAQISEECQDGANETLGSLIHAASPDVAYVASRCKPVVDADSERMTVVELPRRIFPGDKRQAIAEMCDVARCDKTD